MSAERDQSVRSDDRAVSAAPARPRPLLLPTLAFIAGITLSEQLGTGPVVLRNLAVLLPIVTFVLLLVVAIRRRARAHVLHGLVIIAALGVGYARHQAAVRLAPDHIARVATDEPILTRLAGRIVTQPTTFPAEKRNPFLPFDPLPRTRFVLSATELRTTDPPTPISGYVRVSVEGAGIEGGMGDVVVVTGKLYRPRGPRNPGETDWARWNRSQKIYAGLSVEGSVHVRRIGGGGSTVPGLIGSLRAKAQSLLFEPFDQIESDQPVRLLDAMVLGHRSAAGRQLNEAFLRTGSIHFLTVSGFHVGVLAFAVWFSVRRVLRWGARAAACVTMVAIVLYALIAEQNAPILRAATMGVLLCVAQLTRRPFCGLNWLAFSALCILTYNPLELLRAGFQLSFVQVLALFTIVPYLYRLAARRHTGYEIPADADTYAQLVARWAWRWFMGLVIVCGCAWLVSLPLVLFHFGRFAPWGALQSIVVSPLVVLTVVLGFFTLVTLAVLPPVGVVLGFLLRGATDVLLGVVAQLSQLPGTLVETQRPPVAFVVLLYAGLLLLVCSWRARPGRTVGQAAAQSPEGRLAGDRGWGMGLADRRRIAGTLGAVVLAGIAVGWLVLARSDGSRGVTIRVLSVGSGSATLLTTARGQAALFDAGTIHNFDAGETVAQAARALGVRELDLLTISHANFDHYSGVPTVLAKLPTERLALNPYFQPSAEEKPGVRRLLEMIPQALPPPVVWRAGDRCELADATLEVLWPPDGLDQSWKPNDRSLVLMVAAYGRSVMIPGDIEREALRGLLDLHRAGRVDLRADVLIAPHHGGVVPVDTAALYRAVAPEVIVVSTGRERPKLSALVGETLDGTTRLITTHEVGAVTVEVTPGGVIEVTTPFAPRGE